MKRMADQCFTSTNSSAIYNIRYTTVTVTGHTQTRRTTVHNSADTCHNDYDDKSTKVTNHTSTLTSWKKIEHIF